MQLITCHDWTYSDDYRHAWATTNDPRIIAVIERDEEASFSMNLDGDAILPVFLIDRDRADHVGGYQDDESLAHRIVEAQDRFRYAAGYRYNGLSSHHIGKADAMLARWAWIFHGTVLNRGDYGYQYAYDVLIMSTPAFRAHADPQNEYPVDRVEEQARVDAMSSEVAAIADGEVYGIGWAVDENPADDISVSLLDYEIDIQAWGFVGEDYAKQSAAAFEAGTPALPEVLG